MNKTILITGASSGIGKATALLFQARGWNVIATMRQPGTDTELAALDRVLVSRLDVTDLASIGQAVQQGIDRFGRIDVLLNNAGYGAYGTLESFSREGILRQFNTNVIGLLDVTRAVLPHFRTQQNGLVINISSIGGKMTFPLGSLYHGTKFAVEGISESLSYELGAIGCRVKIVEPGAIATDFTGRSFDFSNDESLAEYQPMVGTVMAGMPALFDQASPATVVAGVIYEAATDDSDQLRYTAGEDARVIIANRHASDDAAFIAAMKTQFGI
ncbi:SDR family oxidoreductase [Taibaiella chishuiensis]|uniref:NADP-dependent 3-hydroxy acid dehydrogenase YdfG n=1 Tax=Taibaiella chishuiensis TaxID=1434707 RepID=A0A2P8D7K6_9BACT|nr:SDR family oxidoreductase [Taibaiella chishuiensis]PSK93210.1 NADP-dependent 3-hydroxy acid dehydrogenase YdfG [Taibaiella chishuiensis]